MLRIYIDSKQLLQQQLVYKMFQLNNSKLLLKLACWHAIQDFYHLRLISTIRKFSERIWSQLALSNLKEIENQILIEQ